MGNRIRRVKPLKELFDKLKNSANSLMVNTSLVSMILYILGYLSIRFHLTALGIGTDLTIVDERYLFTGARFVIFLISTIPSLLFLLIIAGSIIYVPLIILPGSLKQPVFAWLTKSWLAFKTWWAQNDRLLIAAIILAVLEIQFLMRQSFFISNLLVAKDYSVIPEFLRQLLLEENSHLLTLFFMLLTGFWVISCCLYALSLKITRKTPQTKILQGLMGFMVILQFLLLPVNYGSLYVDKTMPRVSNLSSNKDLGAGEQAWLVWEGNKGNTYLIWNSLTKSRVLILIPKSEIKTVEITAYDPLLSMIIKQ